MPLTGQRMMFVDEFVKMRCKNATQAAINAGYSQKSAPSQASQILKDAKVIEYLDMRKEQIRSELREEFVFDALEARKVMYAILNNDDAKDADRIKVATDFLDRAGFKALDKVELSGDINTNNPFEGLTTEELKKLINDG